jgi:LmbE family N-acetylglucosaminyl deacetylase
MEKRRLLICYAHPDDESFGLGALIAKYVDEGVDVYLICATNGDAGSMDEEFLTGDRTIKDVRLEELARASEILQFKDVFMLGYHDSGMMGNPENDLAGSLWYTWNHDPNKVTREVVEVMRQVRPHVILTFNEYGGYGHPDHIAIQKATMAAVSIANDPDYVTDGLPPYQPQKVYYSGIQKLPVQIGIAMTRLKGKNPRQLGRNQDIDIVAILEHIDAPTTRIDISQYWDEWDRASACHASQGGGGGSFLGLPRWARRKLFPTQSFTRVFPPVQQAGIIERDLFENVSLTEETESVT